VLDGLAIAEGIEDGLAVLLTGRAPVWAATSAGALAKFPVLIGIECLTSSPTPTSSGRRQRRNAQHAGERLGPKHSFQPLVIRDD